MLLSKTVTSEHQKCVFVLFLEKGIFIFIFFISQNQIGGVDGLDRHMGMWIRKGKLWVGFGHACISVHNVSVCMCVLQRMKGVEGHSVRACLTCGLVGWLDGWFAV